MVNRTDGDQFHFDPATYLERIHAEVPAYDELQGAVAEATTGIQAERVLELGVGTGQTSRRVLNLHPQAKFVGIDESAEMLAAGSAAIPAADLRVSRLQDPLPEGTFDLVVSALAVHHLDGGGKADLFARIAGRLRPGGRFVLGDVVVPDDPADVVTPIDGVYDQPSTADDQVRWLAAAGLHAEVVWARHDLVVIVADSPACGCRRGDAGDLGSRPGRQIRKRPYHTFSMGYYLLEYALIDDYVARRAAFREEHLALAREAHHRGDLILAGALAEPADRAVLVWRADDHSVIERFVDGDPYIRNGLVTSWTIRPWTVVIGQAAAQS